MLRMSHNEKMAELYIHANFMLEYGKWWHLLFYQLEKINYGIKAELYEPCRAERSLKALVMHNLSFFWHDTEFW